MIESTPIFDNSTERPAGKLAFGRDVNQSVADALSSIVKRVPDEHPPYVPPVRTKYLALIVGHTGCGIGYYAVTIYKRDPLLADRTVRMSSSKLGVSDRSKQGDGYAYNLDEMTATEHLLDAGQVFGCDYVTDDVTDGKPIFELVGNPLSASCDE